MGKNYGKKSLLLLLFLCFSAEAFNIDVDSRIIHSPTHSCPARECMFGFSVAQHKDQRGSWLLIGAPEADTNVQGINKGGAVYKCSPEARGTCEIVPFDTKPNSVSATGQQYENKSGQWFGSLVRSSGESGTVLACAPRYVWYSRSYLRREPVGTCYTARNNFEEFIEYSPCRTRKWGYHRQGSCQVGFGADISDDGGFIFIGAVGSWYWQGQIFSLNLNNPKDNHKTKESSPDDDDSYMGYSVTTGEFNGDNDFKDVAVGMPRGANLTGKVTLYNVNMTNLSNLTGDQIGAYFGYSVAAGDFNGDGLDDVVIGAPMWTDYRVMGKFESGRVYVVYQNRVHRFVKWDTINGQNHKARFGLSLACAGNLNLDGITTGRKRGYEDLLVGAPYDGEDHRGAVYVFLGSDEGIERKHSQVIYAKDVSRTTRTFGWSLSSGMDLDDNLYPDVLIGAYDSSEAVYMKSSPVIHLNSEVNFIVDNKQINLDERKCSLRSGRTRVPCVDAQVRLSYDGIGIPDRLDLDLQYLLDAQKDRTKRMFFLESEGQSEKNQTIQVLKGQPWKKTFTVYLLPSRLHDKLTSLDLNVKYAIAGSGYQRGEGLPPVLSHNDRSITDSISIKKDCGMDNECIPNLSVSTDYVESYTTGSEEKLQLSPQVRNTGEDAFNAYLYLLVPKGVNYIKTQSAEDSQVSILCSPPNNANNRTLKCEIGNPLPANSEVTLNILFQPTHEENWRDSQIKSYDFYLTVNSSNPEESFDISDNRQEISIPISVSTDVRISGTSKPEQVSYNLTGNVPDKYTVEDEIGEEVYHIYEVKNKGPSTLDDADVFVLWPSFTDNYKHSLYLLGVDYDSNKVQCEPIDNINPLYVKTIGSRNYANAKAELLKGYGGPISWWSRSPYEESQEGRQSFNEQDGSITVENKGGSHQYAGVNRDNVVRGGNTPYVLKHGETDDDDSVKKHNEEEEEYSWSYDYDEEDGTGAEETRLSGGSYGGWSNTNDNRRTDDRRNFGISNANTNQNSNVNAEGSFSRSESASSNWKQLDNGTFIRIFDTTTTHSKHSDDNDPSAIFNAAKGPINYHGTISKTELEKEAGGKIFQSKPGSETRMQIENTRYGINKNGLGDPNNPQGGSRGANTYSTAQGKHYANAGTAHDTHDQSQKSAIHTTSIESNSWGQGRQGNDQSSIYRTQTHGDQKINWKWSDEDERWYNLDEQSNGNESPKEVQPSLTSNHETNTKDIDTSSQEQGQWIWSKENEKWEWVSGSAHDTSSNDGDKSHSSGSSDSGWIQLPNGTHVRKVQSWSSWSSSSQEIGHPEEREGPYPYGSRRSKQGSAGVSWNTHNTDTNTFETHPANTNQFSGSATSQREGTGSSSSETHVSHYGTFKKDSHGERNENAHPRARGNSFNNNYDSYNQGSAGSRGGANVGHSTYSSGSSRGGVSYSGGSYVDQGIAENRQREDSSASHSSGSNTIVDRRISGSSSGAHGGVSGSNAVIHGGISGSNSGAHGRVSGSNSIAYGSGSGSNSEAHGRVSGSNSGAHGRVSGSNTITYGGVSGSNSGAHGRVSGSNSIAYEGDSGSNSGAHGRVSGSNSGAHGRVSGSNSGAHGRVSGSNTITYGGASGSNSGAHGRVSGSNAMTHGDVSGSNIGAHGRISGSDVISHGGVSGDNAVAHGRAYESGKNSASSSSSGYNIPVQGGDVVRGTGGSTSYDTASQNRNYGGHQRGSSSYGYNSASRSNSYGGSQEGPTSSVHGSIQGGSGSSGVAHGGSSGERRGGSDHSYISHGSQWSSSSSGGYKTGGQGQGGSGGSYASHSNSQSGGQGQGSSGGSYGSHSQSQSGEQGGLYNRQSFNSISGGQSNVHGESSGYGSATSGQADGGRSHTYSSSHQYNNNYNGPHPQGSAYFESGRITGDGSSSQNVESNHNMPNSGWILLENGTYIRRDSSGSSSNSQEYHHNVNQNFHQIHNQGDNVNNEVGDEGQNMTGWIRQPNGQLVRKTTSWASWSKVVSSDGSEIDDSYLDDVKKELQRKALKNIHSNAEPGFDYGNTRKRVRRSSYPLSQELFEEEIQQCTSDKCTLIRCRVGPLKKEESVIFKIRSRLFTQSHIEDYQQKVSVSSKLLTRITKLPYQMSPEGLEDQFMSDSVTTEVFPTQLGSASIPWWVWLLAAIFGLLLLLLIVYCLYRCGFFKRKRPDDSPEREPLNGYH